MKVLLRNPRREIEVPGARWVNRLLDDLGLNREAHLVIRNGTLVPGDARLEEDRHDRGPAGDLRAATRDRERQQVQGLQGPGGDRPATAQRQVLRRAPAAAVPASDGQGDRRLRHAVADDRILVAVSGGKDSLAVWDMLIEAGYQADGLYIGLGIGEYSDESGGYVQRFAAERGLNLIVIDLRDEYGYDVPTAAVATGRVPCSACGLSKRRLFDRAALDGGYDVVVTGHNLDDEAAVLFGNTMRWDIDYLARQLPVLPASDGFPTKVKPLVRLTEREMAAWCLVRGIDYLVEECPMAEGQSAPRLQGDPELDRGELARRQGRVLPGIPRPHGTAARRAFGSRRRRTQRVPALRVADHGRHVCVLPAAREVAGDRARSGRIRVVGSQREGTTMTEQVRSRGEGAPARLEEASLPDRSRRRRGVPLARRFRHPFVDHRRARGRRRAFDEGRRSTPRCGRRSRTSWSRCHVARR